MELSIVIVSFQVQDCLERCLVSLARACDSLTAQIIVIDNASTDNSAKIVRERFPQVELIENSDNLGFAKANNQGLALAKGKYWLLLNPDTVIPEDESKALPLMVAFMESHPRAGACGPSLFYPDGTRQHSAFRFPSLAQLYMDLFPVNWRLRESRLNGRYPIKWYEKGVPFQIDHPLGAALMVRAEAARQVGVLDEAYFIYAEEVDWCMRIKRAGWEIWCVPRAKIIHHEARSTRQFRDKMFVELWNARFILFRKHYSRLWNSAARALVTLGMRSAMRRTERESARAELTAADAQKRLSAYQTVLAQIRKEVG
jgi:hypothetical protein